MRLFAYRIGILALACAMSALMIAPAGGTSEPKSAPWPNKHPDSFKHTPGRPSDSNKNIPNYFSDEGFMYVTSGTRFPKIVLTAPINIAVITAKDIEKHHWHTVGEILRHNGLFIVSTQDFYAPSIITIQEMEGPNILVLLDGIPWRTISGDSETTSIPVDIIDRIEIVKGPVPAWGPALIGLVNIITKTKIGNRKGNTPTGSFSASYGERSILDTRGQVGGKVWKGSYYLYGGVQDSGSLEYDRSFENRTVYGKIMIPLTEKIKASVSAMHTAPDFGMGEYASQNFKFVVGQRISFVRTDLTAQIFKGLRMEFDAYRVNQKDVTMTDLLEYDDTDFYSENTLDEKRQGGGGKVVLEKGMHTLVLGAEWNRDDAQTDQKTGPVLQSYGAPIEVEKEMESDRWGVYVNDTIIQGGRALTAGLRYDDNDYSDSMLSYNLGISWRALENTAFRINYTKGFAAPSLGLTKGSYVFLDPNPDLSNEKLTSYQAGFESADLPYVWIKGTFFYHSVEDTLVRRSDDSEKGTDIFVNRGEFQRRGFEFQAETLAIFDFSIKTCLSYVYMNNSNETENGRSWIMNFILSYENANLFSAYLFGNYYWTDYFSVIDSEYDIIVDCTIRRSVQLTKNIRVVPFFSARNLFNGSHYDYEFRKNAGRWVEFGVKFDF